MNDKLTESLEIPRAVRGDSTLKRKLRVLMAIRGRNLSQQVRYSLTCGADHEIEEVGKKAFDLLCGETVETQPMLENQPGPQKSLSLGNVGKRRRELA